MSRLVENKEMVFLGHLLLKEMSHNVVTIITTSEVKAVLLQIKNLNLSITGEIRTLSISDVRSGVK